MMEIKEWITTVLIAAFIINIIELLLPSGNLKPYCKLAMSFILLFIMISPVLNFINKGLSVENYMLERYNNFEKAYNEKLRDSKSIDEKEISNNYSNYLRQSMNMKLKEYGYEVEEVEVADNEIKNVKIKKTSENSNNEGNKEIQLNENEKLKPIFKNKSLQDDELKNDLKRIYNISVEKIQIN